MRHRDVINDNSAVHGPYDVQTDLVVVKRAEYDCAGVRDACAARLGTKASEFMAAIVVLFSMSSAWGVRAERCDVRPTR